MSRHTQYGNYYDPVGSQNGQASGYTYQSVGAPSNPSQNTGYAANYQYGNSVQGMQQHATAPEPSAGNNANHAAAALSRMSNQNYVQSSTTDRSNTPNQYDNSAWYNSVSSTVNTYGTSNNLPMTNRAQNTNWPSTYTTPTVANPPPRQNPPEQIAASSSTVATSSPYQSTSKTRTDSYQTSYAQRQSQQPPRYNSPLQAVQAQQHAQSNSSRASTAKQPPPQMPQAARWAGQYESDRQQSASVEPSPVTVDPSQVYDNRAELQRKAHIEAERRRKREAEQAAKEAEEERLEAERRKAEEEKQNAEQEASEKEAAKKAEQARKAEQRRKAREEKKQSKNAANALQKMASHAPSGSAAPEAPAVNDEEAEMRAMFQKMREFNAKNPAMLAKLWEEERTTHAKEQAKSAAKAPELSPMSVATGPAQNAQPAAASPTPASGAKEGLSKTAESANSAPKEHSREPSGTAPQATAPIWPAHKKGYLADHTVKWLKSLPLNADSSITSENIFNILDKNPSYVQLCEALETFGLKFDRGSLARVLLSAGPAAFKMQSESKNSKRAKTSDAAEDTAKITAELEQQKAALARPSSSSGPVFYETPQSLSQPPQGTSGFQQPNMPPPPAYGGTYHRAVQSPYFAPPQPVGSGGRAASQSQAPEMKEEDKPSEPPRPPADKEEAARKRTFGDLVDLTAQESDDDDEPPPKRIAVPTAENDKAPAPRTFPTPTYVAPQGFQPFPYRSPTQRSPMTSTSKFSTGQPQPAWGQQVPVVPSQQITVPATHSPQPYAQPAAKPKGPTLEQQQAGRMKGKMLVEPIMRDRVARKSKYDSRTIARDVLLATGRHPDMRSLNSHLMVMQRLLGQHGGDAGGSANEGIGGGERGNRSDLSTIRWDVIDPEPPEEEDKQKESPMHDDARQELARGKGRKPSLQMVDYELPARHSPDAQTPRRGRPPNGILKNRDKSLGESSSAPRPPKPTPTSSRLATPSSAPAPSNANGTMPTGTPVGYAAFRRYNEDGTEIKKKGRPVGWRKNVHSREAQGLAPKTNPYLPSRTKQQQQTGPKPAAVPQQVEPQYQVYACGWTDCTAQLHNLETLKKHVVKMHAIPRFSGESEYECLWRSCVEARDSPKTFDSIEKWVAHVDAKHLSPVAWRLGDGPKADFAALRSDSSSSQPPVYLLDRDGRSVTPIISPTRPPAFTSSTNIQPGISSQPPSSGPPAPVPQTIKPLGRGRPPKDGIPRSQRPGAIRGIDAPLKRLEEQKRIIGPTMDRMGCVLADEGRRRGFLDDEDFEDEVSGSEYG